MPDRNKEAAALLRGIADRVASLEQAISSDQGIPNLLRGVTERVTADDTATVTETAVQRMTWDQDAWDDKRWAE